MSQEATTDRRRPGPVPSLSRDKVIATGLEVLARDGARSVSFRTIALRLGVAPNALYTYVADKDDLLGGMLEATLAAIDLPQPGDRRPAKEQLLDLMISMRRLLVSNAELFNLALSGEGAGRWTLSSFDQISSVVLAVEKDERKAAELYLSLVELAVGSALTSARASARTIDTEELIGLIDPIAHSPSAALARATAQIDRDQLFERSLRTLLNAKR